MSQAPEPTQLSCAKENEAVTCGCADRGSHMGPTVPSTLDSGEGSHHPDVQKHCLRLALKARPSAGPGHLELLAKPSLAPRVAPCVSTPGTPGQAVHGCWGSTRLKSLSVRCYFKNFRNRTLFLVVSPRGQVLLIFTLCGTVLWLCVGHLWSTMLPAGWMLCRVCWGCCFFKHHDSVRKSARYCLLTDEKLAV